MNVGVIWQTSVGFLKCVDLQFFHKYRQSHVNLNVKSRQKFNSPKKNRRAVLASSIYMEFVELCKSFSSMVLAHLLTFVVLKILGNLVSMQSSSDANNCWRNQNFEMCLSWPYLYLKCSFRIEHLFCLVFDSSC